MILLLFTLFYSISYSQTDTLKAPLLRVTLNDGSVFIGRIESKDSLNINLITKTSIRIQIPKNGISEIIRVEDIHPNDLKVKPKISEEFKSDIPDANLSRMIIFPTARPMLSGQWYFSVAEVFFPFASVGIGNFATVGGGITIFPSFEYQLLYFSPKIIPYHNKNFSIAGGVFYLMPLSKHLDNGVGITYSMATIGDEKYSITGGLGWGFNGDNIVDSPIIIIGGDSQISGSSKFMAECWIAPSNDFAIFFIGLRFYNERISGDVALARTTNWSSNSMPFIPWINLTWNFNFIGRNNE